MASGFEIVQKLDRSIHSIKAYKFFPTISNFQSICRNSGVFYRSHVFTGKKSECMWEIDMSNETSVQYLSISATLCNKEVHSETNFIVEFSILDENDKKQSIQSVSVVNGEATIQKFLPKKDLSKCKFLLNKKLRLACQIFDSSLEENLDELMNDSKNLLLEGFSKLFGNEKFSDFKLIVQEKEYCVHRAILAARSSVFEAIVDKNENEAVIDDLEPNTIDKMLRFMYTGQIDLENSAEQILVAAEKYQLESLKLHCENELAKGLTVANIYDILLLADHNNAVQLTKKAIEFFDRNVKTLVAAWDFKESINSLPPDLRTEIIYVTALNR